MGNRGPAPKPTALRVLHGDREDRINATEPKPAAVEPKAPSWLTPAARKIWKRLAPDMMSKGVLTFWDEELFGQFCLMAATKQELLKLVAEQGIVITDIERDSDGEILKSTTKKNPAMTVIRDLTAQMITIGGKFGLTPSDRTRLSMGDGGTDGSEDLFS